jgi:hypothetical protein
LVYWSLAPLVGVVVFVMYLFGAWDGGRTCLHECGWSYFLRPFGTLSETVREISSTSLRLLRASASAVRRFPGAAWGALARVARWLSSTSFRLLRTLVSAVRRFPAAASGALARAAHGLASSSIDLLDSPASAVRRFLASVRDASSRPPHILAAAGAHLLACAACCAPAGAALLLLSHVASAQLTIVLAPLGGLLAMGVLCRSFGRISDDLSVRFSRVAMRHPVYTRVASIAVVSTLLGGWVVVDRL